MQTASGISIQEGIAIGRIRFRRPKEYVLNDKPAADPVRELDRFESARIRVREEKEKLCESAVQEAGKDSASIFLFHAQILDDEELLHDIRTSIVQERKRAEYAVKQAFSLAAEKIRKVDDPYIQERSSDILDVGNSVIEGLMGTDPDFSKIKEPFILACENPLPSELFALDRSLLLGVLIREGSAYSHTAILARAMNLPTLIQCRDMTRDWNGKEAVLDGTNSCVLIDPEPSIVRVMMHRQEEERINTELLNKWKGICTSTRDGKTVHLLANINSPADAKSVLECDAEGVGLFRTEYIYMNAKEDPTEEAQFQSYKEVVEMLSPRPVVIRTCDIGADKMVDYLGLEKEANPALGYRAIRICLTRRDFFKRQLRAILRSSAYGNVSILLPMITSGYEIRETREIIQECRWELEAEKKRMAENIPVGTMIETPAAALCAQELAKEADFFSIGTNDLTQYTLALDRQNARLEPFLDPHHPAVLKQIRMSVQAAHRQGISAGICGELGGNTQWTQTFLQMGIDEFSVNPSSVLPLRKTICSLDFEQPSHRDKR